MQDKNNSNDQTGFAGPFMMGLAIGVAGAVTYAAARTGRLGGFMETKVHNLEDRAVGFKDSVAERVSNAASSVTSRFRPVQLNGSAKKAAPKKATASRAAKPKMRKAA